MLLERIIRALSARTGEDLEYARAIVRSSPRALRRLVFAAPLLGYRGSAPPPLFHLARLGAMLVEDCGPCVQTVVCEARRAGVPAGLLRTALHDSGRLPEPERLAFELGAAVAGGASLPDAARLRLGEHIGARGVTDLTVAAAAVRIFPALKRGLGYARSCSAAAIEVR